MSYAEAQMFTSEGAKMYLTKISKRNARIKKVLWGAILIAAFLGSCWLEGDRLRVSEDTNTAHTVAQIHGENY